MELIIQLDKYNYRSRAEIPLLAGVNPASSHLDQQSLRSLNQQSRSRKEFGELTQEESYDREEFQYSPTDWGEPLKSSDQYYFIISSHSC